MENGGAMVMMKNSIKMSSSYEKEDYTFPSPMTLRFQAIHAACQFQRKYVIGSLVVLLLIIAGIVSAFVIIDAKDSVTEDSTTTSTQSPEPEPAKNYSKNCSNASNAEIITITEFVFGNVN